MTSTLGVLSKVGFSLGHIFNDLCGSMWFSYLLVYMNLVIGQSSLQSGIILFFGQLCDAVATPIVGIESDKTSPKIYGNRKSWHLAGSIAVALSFPFVFIPFPFSSSEYRYGTSWNLFFYYMVIVAIFQFGWAIVQLQHMALIPDFSPSENVRVELNTIRFSATVISNIFTYLLCFFILKNTGGSSSELSQDDSRSFTLITIVIIVVGSVLTILFHVLTKEEINKQRFERDVITSSDTNYEETELKKQQVKWKDWLKSSEFYKVSICYMLSRVAVNVSQVYIPLYIVSYLKLDKIIVTICPLATFIASFATSFILRKIINKFGSKKPIIFGIVLAILTGAWFAAIKYLKSFKHSDSVQAVFASTLLGVVGAVLQICSFSLTTELIGDNTETSGFVLGSMSFVDKMANGLVVLLVQTLIPTCKKFNSTKQELTDYKECMKHTAKYYQYTVSIVPILCGILIGITSAFIKKPELRCSVHHEEVNSGNSAEELFITNC